MKVVKVSKEIKNIYRVELRPSFLFRLFGKENETIFLKDSGSTYRYGGQTIYYFQDGTPTDNFCSISIAIDRFKNSFQSITIENNR